MKLTSGRSRWESLPILCLSPKEVPISNLWIVNDLFIGHYIRSRRIWFILIAFQMIVIPFPAFFFFIPVLFPISLCCPSTTTQLHQNKHHLIALSSLSTQGVFCFPKDLLSLFAANKNKINSLSHTISDPSWTAAIICPNDLLSTCERFRIEWWLHVRPSSPELQQQPRKGPSHLHVIPSRLPSLCWPN